MTNDEIMAELKSDSPLNRARAQFSNGWATLEQASEQRKPPGPVEVRGMEFEFTKKILEAGEDPVFKHARGIIARWVGQTDLSVSEGVGGTLYWYLAGNYPNGAEDAMKDLDELERDYKTHS